MTLTLKVEVAFNAGFSTAAGSRTWTDITNYVELNEGIDIQYGRRDEFSTAEANTLRLTLDNSDGRFTPERSSSPYYPNVKLFRPIRVTATLPDASTSVRFLGYVTQWPTEWENGSTGFAKASLSAVSRLSRLGATTQLRSMFEQEVLVDAPLAYFTLGDPAGSASASDSSGAGVDPMASAGRGAGVVFGSATGPGTDGLTAATFSGGKFLASGYVGPSVVTSEVWFLRAGIPSSAESLLYVQSDAFTAATFSLSPTTGTVSCQGAMSSSANLCDGKWHHLVLLDDPASARILYVDGVVDSTTTASGASKSLLSPSIGGNNAGNPFGETPLTGSVAHVAVYSQYLSAARIAAHYAAGATVLEATGDRLKRLAAYGGVPSGEVDATGTVVVGAQETSGKTVLDTLRDVESSEGGSAVLYDERDGTLTLDARSSRYGATSSFTLDASAQHVGSDFSPTYDQAGLINDATGTGPTTTARRINQTSVNDHGAATASLSTIATNADEPMMLAGWAVNSYSQPRTRVGTLTVDVLPFASGMPSVMNIAAATVGTLISVANLPSQAPASSASYFVEGYSEHFDVEKWEITFNVSPAAPFTGVWALDSGTNSQLGTSTTLAL